jgi:hypothetical protein
MGIFHEKMHVFGIFPGCLKLSSVKKVQTLWKIQARDRQTQKIAEIHMFQKKSCFSGSITARNIFRSEFLIFSLVLIVDRSIKSGNLKKVHASNNQTWQTAEIWNFSSKITAFMHELWWSALEKAKNLMRTLTLRVHILERANFHASSWRLTHFDTWNIHECKLSVFWSKIAVFKESAPEFLSLSIFIYMVYIGANINSLSSKHPENAKDLIWKYDHSTLHPFEHKAELRPLCRSQARHHPPDSTHQSFGRKIKHVLAWLDTICWLDWTGP